jgi:competence protein ComEC
LLLSALHAAVACCAAVLAPWTSPLLTVAARAFLRGSNACSQLDPHYVLPVLSLPQGAALTVGVCALLYVRREQTRRRWVALALAVGLAAELQLRWTEQPTHGLRATFVDVGQGDSTLVDLPDGRIMLIDGGGNPQGGPDPGERALLPLLSARRRSRLDVVVLTHPHPDHYGGLRAVLGQLEVAELWDSGQAEAETELAETSRRAAELVQLARRRGVAVYGPSDLCGRPRNFGGAQVRVLSPCPSYDSNYEANDNSLVLRIDYAGRGLLLTGDIEGHTEQRLVALHAPLRADVLKVAHHGSRTSKIGRAHV